MRMKKGYSRVGGLVAAAVASTVSSVASADVPSEMWGALKDREVILITPGAKEGFHWTAEHLFDG